MYTECNIDATTVAVKKQLVYKCICGLGYPVCNAHAPYCQIWPAWLYYVFPHYLINGTTLGWGEKKVTEHKLRVFSLQLLSEIILILKRNERDMIENVKYLLFLSYFN